MAPGSRGRDGGAAGEPGRGARGGGRGAEAPSPEAARAAEARGMLAWAAEAEARRKPAERPCVVEVPVSSMPSGLSGSSRQSMRVKIVSAKGLRAADWSLTGGKSDPYCVCEIPGKPESRFQTAVIAKTLAPTWNHEQELFGYSAGDSLSFSVYDKDLGKKDDFLGKLTLTSAEFQSGFDGELPLADAGKGVKAFLRMQITPGPPAPGGGAAGAGGAWACPACTLENPPEAAACTLCETPRPPGAGAAPAPPAPPVLRAPSARSVAPSLASGAGAAPPRPRGAQRPGLRVLIESARGLRAADWSLTGGKSDPYCVCEILGKPHAKLQTPHIDKTLEPKWNYEGELPDFSPGDTLCFTVYDRDWGKTDDLLGKLLLSSGQFWPTGFSGELPLSECGGKGIQAYLRVKITPGAEAAAEAWHCPKCSFLNDGAAALCAVCEGPRPEPDGFRILLSRDTFPGRNAHEMPASDIGRCKRVCRERGFGAFVVYEGTAYFRRESPAECLANLVESRDSTAYVHTRDARPLPSGSPTASSESRAFTKPTSGPGAGVPLLVTILRATGLRAADWGPWGGKSDPYCVCEIPNKPQSKFQTPHIDKTLEPVWNHQALVQDFSSGDVLHFTIYDRDWGKADDLLGRATLTSDRVLPNGYEGSMQLEDAGKGKSAFLMVRVEPQARQRALSSLSLSPLEAGGRPPRVSMLSARGLRAEGGGMPEAYCVCEAPGRARARLRTPAAARSSEPVWNYAAELPDYAPGEGLAFAVYNRAGAGRTDELLGRLALPAAQLLAGFDGELPLSGARGGGAFLRLRVEPGAAGPWPPGAPQGQAVTVALEGARGLRHGSPYCVCEIPGRPGAGFRTVTLDRTPNPQWNHVSQVPSYTPGDSLVFTVYDAMKRDEVLGRLNLTSNQFYPTGFRGELPLSDSGKGANAFLALAVEFASSSGPGRQAPGASLGSALGLTIVGARGLRNANWFSYSDSYCICQVPGKAYSKVQTAVVKNSLEPMWNHEAEVCEFSPGDALEFSVWSASFTGADELLGSALLTSAQLWGGFDGEVPLLEGGLPSGAFLRLRLVARTAAPAGALGARPAAARTPDCSLAATALSILSGVPAGLPSDARPAVRAPPALAGARPRGPGAPPPRPPGSQDTRGDQVDMQVASVLDSLGAAYRNAGNLEEALVQSKKALDIRVDAFGDEHPDTAASYCSIGSALRLQDRLDEAWSCHWRALQIRLKEFGDRHADTAASYTCLGAILLQQGDLENALQYYLRALDISIATLGEQHADTAACYNDVGAVFERRGDGKSALQYLLKALEVQRAAGGERHPALGDAHNNAGAVLWQEGRYDEALEHHWRAMEIRLQVLGDRHPDTALSYGNVGVILERLGRYPEALENQQRALEIRLVALGERHSETAASYVNLGVVLERMLRFDQALEHYRKAHSILLAAVGARHAWTEQAQQRIGRCERSWRTMQKDIQAG